MEAARLSIKSGKYQVFGLFEEAVGKPVDYAHTSYTLCVSYEIFNSFLN